MVDQIFFGNFENSLELKPMNVFLFVVISLHLPNSFFFRFIVKDRETFFSSAQRSQIVWAILMRTPYDDEDVDKVIF